MVDLNSSPSNEKPNLDVLFPDLKRADTALPAPRFMAPANAAATLLKGAPPSARPVPPPPSMRKPASVKPPPPSARAARAASVEEIEVDELLTTSPEASPAPLEPIRPVDDEYVDEGPTVALHSPLLGAPVTSRPTASAPRPSSPVAPPSRRAAPPPSAAKLPPLPSAPSSGKHSAPMAASTPSASRLPPVPMPPPSLRNVAPPSMPKSSPPPLPAERDTDDLVPPVSSKAARASAAANLVAASGPARHYVPPSMLPPVSRPFSAQETIPASRAHSLIPTVASVPPPALSVPPQKKSRAGFVALAAVASLGVFGALGFAAIKGGSALGMPGATGAVAITAAGPNGAKVDGLRVSVDGAVKCESAPCRLSDLSTGTHFISAEAPGFAATAARAVSVERGAEATLHIDLVPAAAPPSAAPAPKAEAKATSLDELEAEGKAQARETRPEARSADRPQRAAEKKASKKDEAAKTDAKAPAAEAVGNGTLNINSIPVANVVLDGRPVGSTPLIGLKVSPGPHSVVFIHPEHGRKASGTTVKAGGSATVAVRF